MSATIGVRAASGLKRRFYVGLTALIVAIAFTGFWPSYFGPLLAGTVDKVPFVHFHAAIYVGWLALFATQVVLAATGRTREHMALGRIGVGYGIVMLIVGVAVAFVMFGVRVRGGMLPEQRGQLLAPLTDMAVFAAFFGAAIHYRRRPETHKRLMIVATTSLLIAAVGRMPALGLPTARAVILATWLSPILLAMAYDLLKRRAVHPAYVLGVVVLSGELIWRRAFSRSETWRDIEGWLATFFA